MLSFSERKARAFFISAGCEIRKNCEYRARANILRFQNGMTTAEIAEMQGVSEYSAKESLKRARKKSEKYLRTAPRFLIFIPIHMGEHSSTYIGAIGFRFQTDAAPNHQRRG